MKNPERFSPLADALMASLASRSFQWTEWVLGELEVRSPAGTSQVRTWIRVRDASGQWHGRELSAKASPSQTLAEVFAEISRGTNVADSWPSELDGLPDGPHPDAPGARSWRRKDSLGRWGELSSKF
jgi:hypothetical protein